MMPRSNGNHTLRHCNITIAHVLEHGAFGFISETFHKGFYPLVVYWFLYFIIKEFLINARFRMYPDSGRRVTGRDKAAMRQRIHNGGTNLFIVGIG
jgi:hypothetical protein